MINVFLAVLKRPRPKTFRRLLPVPASFPRKREAESSFSSEAILHSTWMPACAGMTNSARSSLISLADLFVGAMILAVLFGELLLCFVTVRSVDAADAKLAWQAEWEKVLAAAKKEGQVAVYISGYEEVLPEFQKEYPEIKVLPTT